MFELGESRSWNHLGKEKRIIPLFLEGTDKSNFGFLETIQGPSKDISEENVEEVVEKMLSSLSLNSTGLEKTERESVAKQRIKEDLSYLKQLVTEDLENGSFASRGYPIDLLSTFSEELVRELGIVKFRKIQETYSTINSLGYRSNNQDMNRKKYEDTIKIIEGTLALLV